MNNKHDPYADLPEEIREILPYAGLQGSGVPKGLSRCTVCGEWKGRCLDPNPLNWDEGLLTVQCRCDADSCRRCGEQVYHHKIISNYYDEKKREIWHIPWICGLKHRCRR